MLDPFADIGFDRPVATVALHMFAPVAFNESFNGKEQVGPHRLRAQITAPDAARDRIHQKQDKCGEDQPTREVVNLLRPDLDGEKSGGWGSRSVPPARVHWDRGPSAQTAAGSKSPT